MKERINYLYDGTFEGFLTCVYLHYYEDRAAGIYPADRYQDTILYRSRQVRTDPEKAETVYTAIETKISGLALARIYNIFLADGMPDKDNIAFHYICLGFRIGGSLFSLHSDPVVYAAQQTERKVSGEAHRLMGLLRFSALSLGDSMENKGYAESGRDVSKQEKEQSRPEILYAKIEPDHNILELLGEHFSDRFKNEPFIIHDARRGKALYSRGGNWYIAPLDAAALPGFSPEEKEYRRLWKKYFDSIAIEERKNPKCQKRFMPARYWKNLTELQ